LMASRFIAASVLATLVTASNSRIAGPLRACGATWFPLSP
jgi:hypothetical protein